MKKIYLCILSLFIATAAMADENLEPLLNKVLLQLHTEQWVTTKTALVNISVNAAVSGQGIEKIQGDVMQKLNQLSPAEWHILSFDRQLDKSGLESIQIMAQARLPQSDLSAMRDKAKAISKPGVTFDVESVQFVPSEEEIRQANVNLRNNIYQQAKAELDALNKMYPDQKYYLHQISFNNNPSVPMMAGYRAAMQPAMMEQKAAATPLSVGNKQELQATVILASLPDLVTQKLAH